jgi:uncharacterized phage protein gp47/JayE
MADLYQPKNAEELKQRCLRDARLAAIDAEIPEPPTQPGSDLDILATMLANTALIGFANINSLEQDASVFSATGDALDQMLQAEGLPQVDPVGSKGRLKIEVLGPTTIPAGLQFRLPNGLRGRVVGGVVNPSDGSEIDAEAIDTGSATNLKAGTKVQFISPPTNLSTQATVSKSVPLTGGIDAETEDRKRARILNVRRNRPAGGNWSQSRQIANDSLGSVQDTYVYPALGGPSSQKIVPVKGYDRDNNDYSRTLSDAAIAIVRAAVQANLPGGDTTIVQSAANQLVDFGLQVQIPDSTLAGGNGQGWVDEDPWPPLVGGDGGRVMVSATDADFDQITVTAGTAVAPVDGLTHIAWWSASDRRFYRALVTSHSGGAGAWVLGLDRPLVDRTGNGPVLGGDYISPDAQNLDGYGVAWVNLFESLGPGENTSSSDRLPRAKRHPYASDEDPSSVTRASLGKLVQYYPEITDIAFSYSPTTTPTVPSGVDDPPNVLVCRRFGVYPL